MSVNYARLRSLTAREIVAALVQDGFYLRSSGGSSHQRYQHPDFPPKTPKAMIEEQAHWTEDDLLRLRLLKE